MTFEEAIRLKLGDIVYSHCGKKLVISGWNQNFENTCIKDDLYFTCIDSNMVATKYRYEELCGPELCDEDKMFIDWLQNNSIIDVNNIPLLKQAFMSGFSYGFSHKQKIRSEEELQK
jgi:hypothetical protein